MERSDLAVMADLADLTCGNRGDQADETRHRT